MGLVWGVPYLLIKVAVGSFSPAGVVFIRTTVGALILLPLTVVRHDVGALLRRWRPLLLFAAIEVAGPWFLLSDAERRLTSSLSGLLLAAVPLIGAALVWLTGGDERVSPRRLTGMVTGLAGVAVLVGFDVGGSDLSAAGEIAFVALGYAIGPLIIVRRLSDLPAVGVVAFALLATALAYLGLAVTQLPRTAPAAGSLAAVVLLGLVCTAFAFPVFFALIAEVGPVRATVVTYVNPAVAVLAGVVFLGERFTWSTAAGFALIIAGSVLATRRSPRAALPAEPEAAVATPAVAGALERGG